MLQARSDVKPGGIDVALHAMNASSLDILVNYHIKASTWSDELRTRHEVITGIMDLAKDMNIAFAFPTQTIHIASTPTVPAS
jgi:MscS family membrane protein